MILYKLPFKIFVGSLVILLSGCLEQHQAPDQKPLAKVKDQVLTVQEAKSRIPDFVYQQDSVAALKNYRKKWIQQQLLVDEAKRLNLDKKAEVKAKIQETENEVYANVLRDFVIGQYDRKLAITRQEAQNYYEAHKDQFILNERFVKYRHLVAATAEDAQHAKADLMRGIEWPKVAREYSVNPQKAIEQSAEFWPISMAAKNAQPMNKFLKVIGLTEISPIRKINGQYHFVQLVEDRAKGQHPDLRWLMDQIEDWLRIEKRKRHFSSYIKNLQLKAEANNEIEKFDVISKSTAPDNSKISNDTLTTAINDE